MIKAEIITHEGNPGPNWLDHCRTLVTPLRVTVFVLVIAVAITALAAVHHNSNTGEKHIETSQQAGYSPATTSLHVAPVTAGAASQATTSTVQTANGGSTATTVGPAPTTSANALGAAATPSLNTATNSHSVTAPASANGLGGGLTNTVQTTVRKAQSSLQTLQQFDLGHDL